MSPKAEALLQRARECTRKVPRRRASASYEDMMPAAIDLRTTLGYGATECARWMAEAGECTTEEIEAVRRAISRRFRREGL